MLEDTIERYYQELEWAEEALGVFIVRGENVVMLGEIVRNPVCISK
jgi:U6 snRNA-associated Sm-like protein LSm1